MAHRSKSQAIGEAGQELVRSIVSSAGGWIIRGQEKDYGIDLEAELAEPEVLGQLLKFQVRSSTKTKIKDLHAYVSVKRIFLKYAAECSIPIILIFVDLTKNAAYYLWLQEWFEVHTACFDSLSDVDKTVSVGIPIDQTLFAGLAGPLRKIACGETPTQIALNLKGAVRAAISVGDEHVAATLSQLMDEIGKSVKFPIEKIIKEVAQLGDRMRGTVEGNRAGQVLFAMCRKLGRHFTAEQVRSLVLRGDSYSRTGINALGILYDEFPDHIKKLNLPSIFAQHSDPRPAYYCKLRERYLGEKSTYLLSGKADFRIEGLDLASDLRGDLLDKWANRGDSAFLDYLIEVQ